MLLDIFQLTRQRNTSWVCVLLLLTLVTLSWWLFGLVWTTLLCAVSVLSYCAASYTCYRPEAFRWRETITEKYENLFLWALNYSHSSSKSVPVVEQFDSDQTPLNVEPTPSSFGIGSQEFVIRGEPSSTGVLNDVRPPQPQAVEVKEEGESVQPMKKCHNESQKMIQMIMRDFIHTWYNTVTNDTEFPEDVQKVLEHVALEINIRMQQIDLEEVIVELLELILPYLEVLNEAGVRNFNGVELFDVTHEKCIKEFEANSKVAHPAMKSRAHEQRYYRQALDALIQTAFPPEYAQCDIACMFVREILLTNIFEILFNLLCDPAFLYEAIPLVLSKASPEKISRQLDDIEHENEVLEQDLNRGRLIVHITGSQGRTKRRFHSTSGRFGKSAHFSLPSPELPIRNSVKARPHSIAAFPKLQRTSSGIYEPNSSWLTQSSHLPHHKNEESEITKTTYPPPVSAFRAPTITTTSTKPFEEGIREEEFDDESYDHVVDGNFAVVQLTPIYIERHVRVETTGGSNYTAYIFKFPKWMLLDEDLEELGVLESDTHLEGMKRYSEFSKFHDTLMASPLHIYAKGLSLPNKHNLSSFVSKLPFTSNESITTKIIERRQGLEKYLQSVSSVESILSSSDFREFLKSGVKILKESNVVNSQRTRKQNKMGFLGRVRSDDTKKAEPVPKRPLESVLSSYLNTHLPLPCHSFNSVQSARQRTPVKNDKTTDMAQNSLNMERSPRKSTRSSFSSLHSVASTSSLGSNHVNPSSLNRLSTSSIPRSGSIQSETDMCNADFFEHSSTTVPDDDVMESETIQPAMEAIYDLPSANTFHLPERKDSFASSSHSSLQMSGFNEEEHQTIGSYKNSLTQKVHTGLLSLQGRRNSPSQKPKVTFTDTEPTQEHVKTPLSKHVVTKETQEHSQQKNGKLKSLFYGFIVYLHHFITWVIYIVQQGMEPYSKQNSLVLLAGERKCSPLTNALFCLGSEVSTRHCPQLWACSQNTQLSLLVLVGGGMERFLWRELRSVVCDEVKWTRALYNLRHTLWPGGKLLKDSRKKLMEAEVEQLKRKAADSLKKFLPNFFPHIIGAEDYDRAAIHCLDCLRNPRINRHFLLRVIDLFITKLVPETADKSFQKHLSQLRTLHRARSLSDYD